MDLYIARGQGQGLKIHGHTCKLVYEDAQGQGLIEDNNCHGSI